MDPTYITIVSGFNGKAHIAELGVLRGVLYPEVDVNGIEKKKLQLPRLG